METFWIILICSLAAINCSLLGTYLILRKMAMMADAIAHAVLPGIVLAFLITGSKSSWIMFVGASSMGIMASFLMAFLQKQIRLQTDASIGITFTWLFALGIILIAFFSKKVDLDPECVLYGEVAYAPLNVWQVRSDLHIGPWSVYLLTLMLVANLALIVLGYKELAVTTFDAPFAATVGIRTLLWHYVLMGATSFTAVAAFEVAGAVLVVAFFVIPASLAYLLTQRLRSMLLLAPAIGIGLAVVGYYLAVQINGSIAGTMTTLGGILFLAVSLGKYYGRHRSS